MLLAPGVVGLAVIALVAAALIPSGGVGRHQAVQRGRASPVTSTPPTTCPSTSPRCSGRTSRRSSTGPRSRDQEDQGIDANGQLDLRPRRRSRRPRSTGRSRAYRAYAEHWAATLAADLPTLRGALAGGGRAASERAWAVAWSDYLHLGAVYGLLPGTLDAQIDGMPHMLPGDGPGSSFSGLHRIEYGLWTGAPPQSLVPLGGAAAARRGDAPPGAAVGADHAARLRHPRPRDPRGRPARPAQRHGRASGAAPACSGPRPGWPPPRR